MTVGRAGGAPGCTHGVSYRELPGDDELDELDRRQTATVKSVLGSLVPPRLEAAPDGSALGPYTNLLNTAGDSTVGLAHARQLAHPNTLAFAGLGSLRDDPFGSTATERKREARSTLSARTAGGLLDTFMGSFLGSSESSENPQKRQTPTPVTGLTLDQVNNAIAQGINQGATDEEQSRRQLSPFGGEDDGSLSDSPFRRQLIGSLLGTTDSEDKRSLLDPLTSLTGLVDADDDGEDGDNDNDDDNGKNDGGDESEGGDDDDDDGDSGNSGNGDNEDDSGNGGDDDDSGDSGNGVNDDNDGDSSDNGDQDNSDNGDSNDNGDSSNGDNDDGDNASGDNDDVDSRSHEIPRRPFRLPPPASPAPAPPVDSNL